jgi:hypothetical protein
MRNRVHGTKLAALVVLVAASGLSVAAPLQAAAQEITRITIPLTGSLVVTHEGNGCKHSEVVQIQNGSAVHIVADVKKGDRSYVDVTLVDVTGVGVLTNDTYVGNGAHKYPDQLVETSGAWTIDLPLHSFEIMNTTDGCERSELDPAIELQFFNGKLRDTSTAQVFP